MKINKFTKIHQEKMLLFLRTIVIWNLNLMLTSHARCRNQLKIAKIVMNYQLAFTEELTLAKKELINNKRTRGNFQVRSYLKDVFGFAEHQENAIYGLGYKLTLQRNSDKDVLGHRPGATAADRRFSSEAIRINRISDIRWYIPPYTPNDYNKNYCWSKLYLDQQQNHLIIIALFIIKMFQLIKIWTVEIVGKCWSSVLRYSRIDAETKFHQQTQDKVPFLQVSQKLNLLQVQKNINM